MSRFARHFVMVLLAVAAPAFLVGSAGTTLVAQQAQTAAPTPANGAAVAEGSIPVYGHANWQLAARFAPNKMNDLTSSLSIQPRWIQGTERFWYRHETSAGANFIVVDPTAGSKRPIFDNDRIAAELTRITKDPYEGQHLPITSIRFTGPDTIQFDVTSSQDAPPDPAESDMQEQREQQQRQQQQERAARARKLIHHFEYTVSTRAARAPGLRGARQPSGVGDGVAGQAVGRLRA